eukprot:9475416-Pyramimonas_sp.AAC.1
MHRRCIGGIGDAAATTAWRRSGSTSSRIADAPAMQRDPLTASTVGPRSEKHPQYYETLRRPQRTGTSG